MKALLIALVLTPSGAQSVPDVNAIDSPVALALYVHGYIEGYWRARQGPPFC